MAIIELTAPRSRYETLKRAFSAREWRTITWMLSSIVALHVIGFGILFAFVLPGHYKGFGIGLGILVYTLGLRHAFDADGSAKSLRNSEARVQRTRMAHHHLDVVEHRRSARDRLRHPLCLRLARALQGF